jgi:hypothetical protein
MQGHVLQDQEGAGNAGRLAAPAALRAKVESTQASHHRSAATSGIPCARVLTVSFALSLVIGLFVTIPGAMRQHCRQVDISVEMSGPRDFTVHGLRIRQSRSHVHRIPRPTSVTIAIRPSCKGARRRGF